MGQSISVIKDTVDHKNDKDKAELEERLNFLQTTTTDKMKVKLQEMLHASVADLQIHGGTVVEYHIRVKIDATSDETQLESAIDDLFEGDFLGGIKKLAKSKVAVQRILGNGAIGECEQQDFEVLWTNGSLVRVDFYCWRYNFSSRGVITDVENVFAYVVVKRVIDWNKVDRQVVTYCLYKMKRDSADVMKEIDDVTEVIKKLRSAIEAPDVIMEDSSKVKTFSFQVEIAHLMINTFYSYKDIFLSSSDVSVVALFTLFNLFSVLRHLTR